jgi:hypothetical protein
MHSRAPASTGSGASSDDAGFVVLCLKLGRPCGRNPGCRNSPVDRWWWKIHPQVQASGPKWRKIWAAERARVQLMPIPESQVCHAGLKHLNHCMLFSNFRPAHYLISGAGLHKYTLEAIMTKVKSLSIWMFSIVLVLLHFVVMSYIFTPTLGSSKQLEFRILTISVTISFLLIQTRKALNIDLEVIW